MRRVGRHGEEPSRTRVVEEAAVGVVIAWRGLGLPRTRHSEVNGFGSVGGCGRCTGHQHLAVLSQQAQHMHPSMDSSWGRPGELEDGAGRGTLRMHPTQLAHSAPPGWRPWSVPPTNKGRAAHQPEATLSEVRASECGPGGPEDGNSLAPSRRPRVFEPPDSLPTQQSTRRGLCTCVPGAAWGVWGSGLGCDALLSRGRYI